MLLLSTAPPLEHLVAVVVGGEFTATVVAAAAAPLSTIPSHMAGKSGVWENQPGARADSWRQDKPPVMVVFNSSALLPSTRHG